VQGAEEIDQRVASRIGRQARLELVFATRGGRTVLAHAYGEPPFRVGQTFPEGAGLHMILASSAPGIFGGDLLEQRVHLERGARVRLTSQSALQVHPSPVSEAARLHSVYVLDEGAQLQCEWDLLIPFADSRLTQRIEIRAAAAATLYWSDALMSGREGRGERWRFSTLDHELRLLRAGSLDYLERYQISPASASVARPWIASDSCYFGTILQSGSGRDPQAADELHRDLAGSSGLRAGVDLLEEGLTLVRLMAKSGVVFHEARARVRRFLCA
jgi:urease accessory protein UreH